MSRAHYFLVANVLVNDIDDSKIILVPGAFPSEIERRALGTWLQKNSAMNICFSLCDVAASSTRIRYTGTISASKPFVNDHIIILKRRWERGSKLKVARTLGR